MSSLTISRGLAATWVKTESSDYEIQIPMNQTLITINARGFASEQEALAFASKLDLAKIKSLIGE